MTRTARPSRAPGRSGPATLGALLALAVVVTAGAPSVITVRPGDTLWDLAREHGTTVSALRTLNDLPGTGTIYAGDTLQLSGSGSSGPAPSGPSSSSGSSGGYLVREGDTLSEIAVRFGTTSAALRAANGLTGSAIVAGRRLTVPGNGAVESVPQTNAGRRIPEGVRRSVADNRALLASRDHPSRATVRRMVADTARQFGVSPSLAVAVAYQESGFQQRVVSGVNAIGVMQVLPTTGRALGQQYDRSLDLLDTQDNITAGVLLLRQLQRTTPTTERLLAGYYQGAGSIARQGILPQTEDYVRSIEVLRRRFANG